MMARRTNSRLHSGFTLIELLVVLSIISVVVALLFPAVQNARAAARRAICSNKLKQMGIALHSYHELHETLPSGWIGVSQRFNDPDGLNGFGWGLMVLPYLEQQTVFEQFDADESLMSTRNDALLRTSIAAFRCPADSHTDAWEISHHDSGAILTTLAAANYVGVFGSSEELPGGRDLHDCEHLNGQCKSNGVFYHNSRVRLSDIDDGLGNTFMIGERRSTIPGSPQHFHSTWSGVIPHGEDAFARVIGVTDHQPNSDDSSEPHLDDFSSHHDRGAMFLLADGHVRFISDKINRHAYQHCSTISNGELVCGF